MGWLEAMLFIQRAHRYVPGMNLADNISRLALSRIFYAFFKQVVYNLHSSNALIRLNGLEVGINLSGQAVLLFLHPYPAHNFTGFRVFYHDHSASVFCFG